MCVRATWIYHLRAVLCRPLSDYNLRLGGTDAPLVDSVEIARGQGKLC